MTTLLISLLFFKTNAQEQQIVEPADFSVGISNNARDLSISNIGNGMRRLSQLKWKY